MTSNDLVERLRDGRTVGAYVQPTFMHSPDYGKGRALLTEAANEIERLRNQLAASPAPPAQGGAARGILNELSYWCTDERQKLGAVDGYDYRSGKEFGIRRVELQIEKRLHALAALPDDKRASEDGWRPIETAPVEPRPAGGGADGQRT